MSFCEEEEGDYGSLCMLYLVSWNSLAEKMFTEDFEEKDGLTYEAMIQGLVKVGVVYLWQCLPLCDTTSLFSILVCVCVCVRVF